MNITQIKAELGVANLDMFSVLNAQGEDTGFVSNWNNTTRVRTIMHLDVFTACVAGATDVTYRTAQKPSKASGEEYTEIFIIIPKAKPIGTL